MKKLISTITVCLFLSAIVPAQTLNVKEIEKGVQDLAKEYIRSWNSKDIDANMACFGRPEGLIILGGEAFSLDSIRVKTPRDYWNRRKDEYWENTNVSVIPLTNTSALMQITLSGRFTNISTGVTWEYKSSAFSTALVKKIDGKWKMVTFHNSGAGRQVPK